MSTAPDTQNRSTVPVATALGRTTRPFTESAPRRLAGLAVGIVAGLLLTAGAAWASAPTPTPSPGPGPTAPTCAELHVQRTLTSPSCEWYRSRAIAEAARLRACAVPMRQEPTLATFRYLAPTAY